MLDCLPRGRATYVGAQKRLVHTHRRPEVSMEKRAKVEARELLDQVARGGVHHIVVLELGARLHGHGKVAEAPDQLGLVISDREVVSRVACAMAERVFDGDVLCSTVSPCKERPKTRSPLL